MRTFTPYGAIDLLTGVPIWSKAEFSLPTAALDDGRAVYGGFGTASTVHGADGSVQAANQPSFIDGPSGSSPLVLNGDTWFGTSVADWTAPVAQFGAVVATSAFAAPYSFSLSDGNERGSQALIPRGTGLFAKGHSVAFGNRHAGIWVVPSNQSRWLNPMPGDPLCPTGPHAPSCFIDGPLPQNVGIPAGHSYLTIGAEGTQMVEGSLVSRFNRDSDVATFATDFERLRYAGSWENQVIQRLFVLNGNFQTHSVGYQLHPVPTSGQYNSNSFTSGLLIAAQIKWPHFATQTDAYSGWTVPVPLPFFRRVQ